MEWDWLVGLHTNSWIMEENDFYIVLPSNVKRNDGMENKTSCYLTPLAKPMELNKSHWEVAIAEFSYPHSWYNIEPTVSYIKCMKYNSDMISYVQKNFPPGHYTGPTLATRLNACLEQCGMNSNFNYEGGSNMLRLELHPDEGLLLPEKLALMMGWQNENEFTYSTEEYAPNIHGRVNPEIIVSLFPDRAVDGYEEVERPVYLPQHIYPENCLDLNPNTHHLYIYCNLVNEIVVGDIFAKLLRTVSTRSEDYGQYVTRTFTTPHYIPLASSFENFVEISIRDDVGRLIPFESGKVIVTLHFRKQKKWR